LSKKELLEQLQDPEYRAEFVSSEIDMGLPMQLRAMRESRGWKQSFVAEKTNTQQPRFSLMERPGYGKYSLNTLKKLAALFDVGLIVSFVPWGEMIDFVESLGPRRLSIPSFCHESNVLSARYSRQKHIGTPNNQLQFIFSTGQVRQEPSIVSPSAPYQEVSGTKESLQVPPEMIETVDLAYLAQINLVGGTSYDTAR